MVVPTERQRFANQYRLDFFLDDDDDDDGSDDDDDGNRKVSSDPNAYVFLKETHMCPSTSFSSSW